MSVQTSNLYGKIVVTNRAIRSLIAETVLECPGVWGFRGHFADFILSRRMRLNRNILVRNVGKKIAMDIDLVLKYGVSTDAVVESVRSAVKYGVENFTGMIVAYININVVGIKK